MVVVAQFLFVHTFASSEALRSLAQLERASSLAAVVQAVVKAGLIGAGIAGISCHVGLQAPRADADILRAASRAVAAGFGFGVLANAVLFALFHAVFGFAVLTV